MMKYLHLRRTRYIKYFTVSLLILLLVNCTTSIDSIVQPLTAKVNEVITVKLEMSFQADLGDSKTMVFGVLAPKGWKLGQNGNATVSLTSTVGSGNLSLMPLNRVAAGATQGENWPTRFKNKLGIGPNFIDDMEWVVFQTDSKYTVPGGTKIPATFTVKMKVGVDNRNTSVKLGYVICNSDDGLGTDTGLWNAKYADCLSITGGSGDLIDFCNPALAVIAPTKVTDNEYVTIQFDNTIIPTKLTGSANTYLCATAHTTDNQDITVCTQDDKTKMLQVAENKYSITIWPKGFFNVPQGKTLKSIDYFFTDKTGNTKVGFGNSDLRPFRLTFGCD